MDLPTIDPTGQYGDFKFMQIYVDDEPLLRFIPTRFFHRDMLKRFLQSELKMTDYPTIGGGNREPLPALEGERYRVCGMGLARVSPGYARLYSQSFDYNIGPNAEHVEALRTREPEWIFELG